MASFFAVPSWYYQLDPSLFERPAEPMSVLMNLARRSNLALTSWKKNNLTVKKFSLKLARGTTRDSLVESDFNKKALYRARRARLWQFGRARFVRW